MEEERVQQLAACLRPVLSANLPPDAAGSTAMAMALLSVQAEAEAGTEGTSEDALLDQVELLPIFVEAERERGSTDDLPTLVRRFVRGERARTESEPRDPAAIAAAQRRIRLRELQRGGVDLSLIEATLALSPMQRIANMERQLHFIQQLQEARRAQESTR